MNGTTGRFGWLGSVVLLLTFSLLAGRSACANPPPPTFWDFQVTNSTGQTVTNIEIKLYPTADGSWDTFEDPIVITIPKLLDGRTLVLGTYGVWCIAKINVTAKCPATKSATVEIVANASPNYIPNNGKTEYSGFTPEGPQPQWCSPVLTFFHMGDDDYMRVSAKWRWENDWPGQPVVDQKKFQ